MSAVAGIDCSPDRVEAVCGVACVDSKRVAGSYCWSPRGDRSAGRKISRGHRKNVEITYASANVYNTVILLSRPLSLLRCIHFSAGRGCHRTGRSETGNQDPEEVRKVDRSILLLSGCCCWVLLVYLMVTCTEDIMKRRQSRWGVEGIQQAVC